MPAGILSPYFNPSNPLGGKFKMNSWIKKVLSLFLVLVTLLGTLSMPGVFADEETDADKTSDTASDLLGAPEMTVEAVDDPEVAVATEGEELPEETAEPEDDGQYHVTYDEETLNKLIGVDSYSAYSRKYKDVGKGSESVVINAVEAYNAEQSTAEVSVESGTAYGDGSIDADVLVTGGSGETVFNVTVPKEGMYAMKVTYASVVTNDEDATEISTTIERMLYIDDALPFSETRYLYFPRTWEYEYESDENGELIYDEEYDCLTFPEDKNGNDTRPRRWEKPAWQTYYVRDWLGFEIDPFEFYFTEGEHTVTMVSNREQMVIYEIELYKYDEEPMYDDWLEDMKADGVKEITVAELEELGGPIKVQAENPDAVSVQNIIPGSDRTSSITEPQDPSKIKYNILDTGAANNWMKYTVNAPKAGLYSLSFRFRQNSLIGMFTSRRVLINGEIQFREASYLRFMYETSFQSSYANNGKQDFLFYLEEGENEIMIEVVLGEMVQYVYRIEQLVDELNDVYQKMLMITGPVPDSYRDYGFYRLVPECIESIAEAANELYDIQESIIEMTGEEGDQTNTLETIAELFEDMATDEYEIAPNFLTFKNYIIALSDWLYAALGQPVKLDYFVFGGTDEELPQAVSSTWQTVWFECRAFVASFTMDYTTIGFSDDAQTATEHTIEMWSISDRESMLITRYLVDNYFTPESGISLRIKVITAGLTEAILAGIGPDVSFLDTTNTITFGMRSALLAMEDFEGYDELMAEFPEGFKTRLTMDCKDGERHSFGVPTSIIIPMAFYRLDVLSELGVEIPDTWDDLLEQMPALLNNNMDIGLSTGLIGLELFLYQTEGGDLYDEGGYSTNLDDPVSLSAFKTMSEMFQKYSAPVAYDITRFRTGEIPIMVSNDGITIYNMLMTYYELRGLWIMAPVIGTLHSDGKTIDRTAIADTLAMVMPRGGNDPEIIWEFVKWYCGADAQNRLARESLAVSLPTNKHSTANVKALLAQKWTDEERSAIRTVIDFTDCVPEYPGAYILTQYVSFAFLDTYNNGTNAADAMLEQITYINKEISRKRKEFGLDYLEITYGEEEDRLISADED